MTEISLKGTPEDIKMIADGLNILSKARQTDPSATFFLVVTPFDDQEYYMDVFEKARQEKEG